MTFYFYTERLSKKSASCPFVFVCGGGGGGVVEGELKIVFQGDRAPSIKRHRLSVGGVSTGNHVD